MNAQVSNKVAKSVDDELVLSVIDQGLGALGESPRRALWYCLEKDFNLCRETMPKNIASLEEALQKFFGLGYCFLESLFKKYMSEATGEVISANQTFAEFVEYLRSKPSKSEL